MIAFSCVFDQTFGLCLIAKTNIGSLKCNHFLFATISYKDLQGGIGITGQRGPVRGVPSRPGPRLQLGLVGVYADGGL